MKTAIYVENGITQIVLTPESDFEKDIVDKMGEDIKSVQLTEGYFHECVGGWVKQNPGKTSLILRVDK